MRTETQEFSRLQDYKGSEKAMKAISNIDSYGWNFERIYADMVDELGEETTDEEIADYLEYITDEATILAESREQEEMDEYEQEIAWNEILYWDER